MPLMGFEFDSEKMGNLINIFWTHDGEVVAWDGDDAVGDAGGLPLLFEAGRVGFRFGGEDRYFGGAAGLGGFDQADVGFVGFEEAVELAGCALHVGVGFGEVGEEGLEGVWLSFQLGSGDERGSGGEDAGEGDQEIAVVGALSGWVEARGGVDDVDGADGVVGLFQLVGHFQDDHAAHAVAGEVVGALGLDGLHGANVASGHVGQVGQWGQGRVEGWRGEGVDGAVQVGDEVSVDSGHAEHGVG